MKKVRACFRRQASHLSLVYLLTNLNLTIMLEIAVKCEVTCRVFCLTHLRIQATCYIYIFMLFIKLMSMYE